MNYQHPSEIMDEIARLTPTFAGVSFELLDRLGSVQWPCNAQHPEGTPLKLALDTEAVISLNANNTRVLYSTNTEPGSSGSPRPVRGGM